MRVSERNERERFKRERERFKRESKKLGEIEREKNVYIFISFERYLQSSDVSERKMCRIRQILDHEFVIDIEFPDCLIFDEFPLIFVGVVLVPKPIGGNLLRIRKLGVAGPDPDGAELFYAGIGDGFDDLVRGVAVFGREARDAHALARGALELPSVVQALDHAASFEPYGSLAQLRAAMRAQVGETVHGPFGISEQNERIPEKLHGIGDSRRNRVAVSNRIPIAAHI